MIVWLVRQGVYFRGAVLSRDTPRQLALGLAMGMVIGLLPKGNLLALGLSTVLLATRVNLSVAMIAVLVFSLIGRYVDGLTHPIGLWLLASPKLVPFWEALHELPLAPWTSFNNTVVLGSLVFGGVLFFPAYRVSRAVFERIQVTRTAGKRRRRVSQSEVALETASPGMDAGKTESGIWMAMSRGYFAYLPSGHAATAPPHFAALAATRGAELYWENSLGGESAVTSSCVCSFDRAVPSSSSVVEGLRTGSPSSR